MTSARIIDLSLLTAPEGFILQGDQDNALAGYSVSAAGDVNGDGIADLIVGARTGNAGGDYAGQAHVIYGQAGTTRLTVDLSSLAASEGFTVQGDMALDYLGASVSFAGDVNGDGVGDLIVGAPQGGDGGSYAGEAYVIYGQAGATRGTLDLTGLAASDGFVIQGDAAGDYAGYSVSGGHDVNGDGIADMIVGAYQGDDGGISAGEAYVIYGQTGVTRTTVDLTGLAASDGFIIQGDAAGDLAGRSVSMARDLNGDGIADMIVGALLGDDGGTSAGEAYVIYGQAGTTRTLLDLSTLSVGDGFIIQGDTDDDTAGSGVSDAGDVNGDGIGDLLVGAYGDDDGGDLSGAVYVIYGQAGATRGTLDLSTLSASDGFIIQGDLSGDRLGQAVSAAGDVNGDGLDDVIVGARLQDGGGTDAGAAYVIYGQAGTSRGTVDLSALDAADGFIVQGDVAGDEAGFAVSGGGDVNGDGIDDVIVGAPLGGDGGPTAGEGYVIYGGSATGFGAEVTLATLGAPYGFTINGAAAGDAAGYSVDLIGDVNGDGIGDMLVGAVTAEDGGVAAGAAYVIYGQAGATRTTLDLTSLSASEGYVVIGDMPGDLAGTSVSGAGDINGDGIGDLIIGAPFGDDGGNRAGEAYILYGAAGTTRTVLDLTGLSASDGFVVRGDSALDYSSAAVSGAGDVNGDGIGDLLVPAKQGDDAGGDAGEVYVVFGQAGNSRTLIDLTGFGGSDGFIIQGDSSFDRIGYAVAAAGDVNGDGIDDIIVSSQQGDDGGWEAGEAYVIYGAPGATRATLDTTGLAASDGFIIQGDVADDRAGVSVAGAGDINGDGIDDMIVGAHRGDDGGANAGEAYVIYGQAGATRGLVDLTGLSASDGFIIQGDLAGDEAGFDVAGAGDINGDGIDDMIVGALNHDGSGIDAGAAYVVFGQGGSTRTTLDLSSLSPSEGFRIAGVASGDQAGRSVAGGGDVNGDGIDDLIVGAPGSDTGGAEAGAAYVIYGRRPSDAVTRSGTDQGEMILGGQADDTLEGSGGNDTLDGGSGADNINPHSPSNLTFSRL